VESRDLEKRAAAEAAAELVQDGMALGLGTGSTVAFFLLALARRAPSVRCVATSAATEAQASALGVRVESFEGALDALDLAVDGADQVARDRWPVKGGGGAHTREKIGAAAAARFVVIASEDKLVERVGPAIPLELLRFGLPATLRRLADSGPSSSGGARDRRGRVAVPRPGRGPAAPPRSVPCPAWSTTGCSRRRWSRPSWWAGRTGAP
jgi:ribose 5-phosphate isomerase